MLGISMGFLLVNELVDELLVDVQLVDVLLGVMYVLEKFLDIGDN